MGPDSPMTATMSSGMSAGLLADKQTPRETTVQDRLDELERLVDASGSSLRAALTRLTGEGFDSSPKGWADGITARVNSVLEDMYAVNSMSARLAELLGTDNRAAVVPR